MHSPKAALFPAFWMPLDIWNAKSWLKIPEVRTEQGVTVSFFWIIQLSAFEIKLHLKWMRASGGFRALLQPVGKRT